MIVHALMPPIHDWLTGGSLYNNRILEHLRKSAAVCLHIDLPNSDSPEDSNTPPDPAWDGGLWLADSLCLNRCAAHLQRRPDATGVLIAHYLKALDPRYRQSAAAEAELAALRPYRAVITTSQFSRRALLAAGYQGRVEALLPGLSDVYRRPLPSRPPDSRKILTVGSLLPDKGLAPMLARLEAFPALDWSWEIVGDSRLDPDFAEDLRNRVQRSPWRDRILVRGALAGDLVADAYDRSDIFALPSRFESCSMATMEAMARGLPVAAFRVGGLPDLLPESCRTLLADSGDWEGLARTVDLFLQNAALRRSCGEANHVASANLPSWGQTGAAVERLLNDLIAA